MIKVAQQLCTYCLSFVLLALLTVCSDNQEESTSRSGDDEVSYWKNYMITSTLLNEYAYNQDLKAEINERFKLVHISDAHISDWSDGNHKNKPKNLLEAVRFANQTELRINAMVHTGDHIGNTDKTTLASAEEYFASFTRFFYESNQIPSFVSVGNHDANMMNPSSTHWVTRENMNRLLISKQNYVVQAEPKRNYFYTDLPSPQGGMIRFISLDPTDQDGGLYNAQHLAIFSREQIDWLCHKALKENMTAEHSVIILLHYAMYPDPDQPGAKPYENHFVHAWGMIPEIIEAFRSKTSWKWDYANKIIREPELSIPVDVDFSQTPGEFICYLGGHVHTYDCYEVGGIRNASPDLPKQREVICNNMSPCDIGTLYNTIMRKNNSVICNSFNVYAIDTNEKKVYITIFGAYKPSSDPAFERVQSFSYL